tara:strand:- start:2771 stop:3268 length:498 start_codon:yes stop_codon:yes gene_type:complete
MKKVTILLVLLLTSNVTILAQKINKKNLYVKVKDDKKPMVFVDGKKFEFPVELIDQTQIESINILKGEKAISAYNAPNGVIIIKTKQYKSIDWSDKDKKEKLTKDSKKEPLVIVDGKVTSRKFLETLDSNKIEKMEVLKGEKAIKKYNSPNGVIIITTKKKYKLN